jgi:hypothetical protein
MRTIVAVIGCALLGLTAACGPGTTRSASASLRFRSSGGLISVPLYSGGLVSITKS